MHEDKLNFEGKPLFFIVRKWRTASIQLKVNWFQPLKLLDERVSIAPQQPLPVLSMSHFLPRKTQAAAVCQPTIGCTSILSLFSPLSSQRQRRSCVLKMTPWLSPPCAQLVFFARLQWGEKRAGTSVKHKKRSIYSHCSWLMREEKKSHTVQSTPSLHTKQMCNRNLMWHHKWSF